MEDVKHLPYWMQYTTKDQLETPVDTKIIGEIPKWLTGTLYRNGAGMYKVGETTVKHLFDGMSVLHKFVIKDGKVTYQNKPLNSDSLNKSLKANRLVVTQFATLAVPDPCKNIFSRFFSYFKMGEYPDNTAVNIVPYGDMLIAMTETPRVNIVDPESLQKKDQVDMDKVVAVHLASAHPHTDVDGCMYNLGTSFNYKQAYSIIKSHPPGKDGDNPLQNAELVAAIPSRWKTKIAYNHSFGMSENHFIILEQTLTMDLLQIAFLRFSGKPFSAMFRNFEGEKAIIHIIRRSDGKEVDTRYMSDDFFCFHFINCYEEDGHLVIDMSAFDTADVMNDLYVKDIIAGSLGECFAKVRRYVLPLDVKGEEGKNLVTLSYTSAMAVKQADGTVLCTPDYVTEGTSEFVVLDLPRINYSYNTRKYRYAYGTMPFTVKNTITKLDFQTRTTITWKPEVGHQAGEPVFVSRPDPTEEDDGVILSPVFPMEPENPSMLVVLDAKTMKELGRAVAPVGIKMPMSFHGCFVH